MTASKQSQDGTQFHPDSVCVCVCVCVKTAESYRYKPGKANLYFAGEISVRMFVRLRNNA